MPSGGFNPIQFYTGQIMDMVLGQHAGTETDAQRAALQQQVLHWLEQAGNLNNVQNQQQFILQGAHYVLGNYDWSTGQPKDPNNPPKPPGDPNAPSSPSGSSGSSGSSSPDFAAYVSAYKEILHQWGIKVDDNLQKLMDNAAHNKAGGGFSPWDTTRFIQALRKTNEYHDAFVGINQFPNMTEAQYIAQKQQYFDAADTYHVDINNKKVDYLFKNGVSVAEFTDRSQAYQLLDTNKEYFDQFKEQLKAMGYKKIPTNQELFKWILSGGRSNKEWTKIWEDATVRYQADMAGINFVNKPRNVDNEDTNLGSKLVGTIAKKVAAGGTPAEGFAGNFADLAQQLKTTMPLSRMAGWGLTKQDLVELEFGGSRQAAIAEKVTHILQQQANADTARPYSSSNNIGSRGSQLTAS